LTAITVYSQPNCQPCKATKRKLDQLGVNYRAVDVADDETALATIRGLGYQQTPVVVAGEQHWSGYRPHMLEELAHAQQQPLGGPTAADQ